MSKTQHKQSQKTAGSGKVIIQLQLEGDEAARFLGYKSKQYLKNHAEAGRKLLLERLAEVEAAEKVA